ELTAQLDAELNEIETAFQEAGWAADAVLDAAKTDAEAKQRNANTHLKESMEELEALREETRAVVQSWNQETEDIEEEVEERPRKPLCREISECIEEIKDLQSRLRQLLLPRVVKGFRLHVLFFLLWLLLIYPLGALVAGALVLGTGLIPIL